MKDTPREQYLLDSAHHGIAMNPARTRICRPERLLRREDGKPYRVTPRTDGRFCDVSWSGTDEVSRIRYRTGRIDETVRVGGHPQRIRDGFVRRALVAGLPDHVPPEDVQDPVVTTP